MQIPIKDSSSKTLDIEIVKPLITSALNFIMEGNTNEKVNVAILKSISTLVNNLQRKAAFLSITKGDLDVGQNQVVQDELIKLKNLLNTNDDILRKTSVKDRVDVSLLHKNGYEYLLSACKNFYVNDKKLNNLLLILTQNTEQKSNKDSYKEFEDIANNIRSSSKEVLYFKSPHQELKINKTKRTIEILDKDNETVYKFEINNLLYLEYILSDINNIIGLDNFLKQVQQLENFSSIITKHNQKNKAIQDAGNKNDSIKEISWNILQDKANDDLIDSTLINDVKNKIDAQNKEEIEPRTTKSPHYHRQNDYWINKLYTYYGNKFFAFNNRTYESGDVFLYSFVIGDKSPIEINGEEIVIEKNMKDGEILFKNKIGETMYCVNLIRNMGAGMFYSVFNDKRKKEYIDRNYLPFDKIYDALERTYSKVTNQYIKNDIKEAVKTIESDIASGAYQEKLKKIKTPDNQKVSELFVQTQEKMNDNNPVAVKTTEQGTQM